MNEATVPQGQPAAGLVLHQLHQQPAAMVNFKHPDEDEPLTEEEIRTALLKAKIEKARQRREREYFEQLSKPKTYQRFTARELWSFALERIRKIVPAFAIDDHNKEIFTMLSLYFAGDKRFEERGEGFSLDKGIALFGPVGCGKTTIMRAFAVNSYNSFHEVSCRKVADDYSLKETGGAKAIAYYSNLKEAVADNHFGQRQIGFFYDDLGTETAKKHFGNHVNIMEDVILNRYDNPTLHSKTHLTTNLSGDQIGEAYGERCRSRLRGMCNSIFYGASAGDRRV